jgi:hypothetical protein
MLRTHPLPPSDLLQPQMPQRRVWHLRLARELRVLPRGDGQVETARGKPGPGVGNLHSASYFQLIATERNSTNGHTMRQRLLCGAMPACVTAQAARFKIGVWGRKEKTRAFAGKSRAG